MDEYSEDEIPTAPLFLSITTALSHYTSHNGMKALNELFPLSPSSIFLSPDPPMGLLIVRGVGVYIELYMTDKADKRDENESEIYGYLAPEVDGVDRNRLHELSGREKEAALVYSLGLIILLHMTHKHPLSDIADAKEGHNSQRSAHDVVINTLISQITHRDESLISLIQCMLSSDAMKRPRLTDIQTRLNAIVHPISSNVSKSSMYLEDESPLITTVNGIDEFFIF